MKKPAVKQKRQEQKVRKIGMPAAEGPQKTVYQAKASAHKKGRKQPQPGLGRGDHPRSRLSQEPEAALPA